MPLTPPRSSGSSQSEGLLHGVRLVLAAFPGAIGWTVALFCLFNVLGDLLRPRFDANYTWMPLDLYGGWARLFMGAFGLFLLWSLVRPAAPAWRYVVTQAMLLFLCVECLRHTRNFYSALADGRAGTWLPVPFALPVLVALALQLWRVRRAFKEPARPPAGSWPARVTATAAGMLIVWEFFLLGQMFMVGTVSWPRRADCIIVMGAGVTPDGRPSLALVDRVREGVNLYRRGFAPRIVMSGGPGVLNGPTEPAVMADLALNWRVAPAAVIRDDLGLTSFDTAVSCRRIMMRNGWRRALVVSHDYHLSRTMLAFYRAGVPVSTAPAPRTRLQVIDFWMLVRESCAWTYYYFRPFWQTYDTP